MLEPFSCTIIYLRVYSFLIEIIVLALDVTQFNLKSDQLWNTANKQFEYLIKPAEQCVASKLKTQFSNINANTRQVNFFG